MRKITLVFLILLPCLLVQEAFTQGRYNPAYTSMLDGAQTYRGRMTWNKKIQGGDDSLFVRGTTSPVIVGAKDTLYSDIYRNRGYTNMQIILSGGTTNRLKVVVQGANGSNHAATAIPDSLFRNMYWLTAGVGVTGSIVSTSEDSIIAACVTAPIIVPLLDAQYFKILVYTSSQQVSNPTINIDLFLRSR